MDEHDNIKFTDVVNGHRNGKITLKELSDRWGWYPYEILGVLKNFDIRCRDTGEHVTSESDPCIFCKKKTLYGGKETCPLQIQISWWDLTSDLYGHDPLEKPVIKNHCKKGFASNAERI